MGGRLPRRLLGSLALYTVLLVLLVLALAPFLWMISSSLKMERELYQYPAVWIPARFNWENYRKILLGLDPMTALFERQALNSLIVSFGTSAFGLLVGLPCAYAFSRFQFPGKRSMFLAVLLQNVFPLIAFLVPLYFMMGALGMRNTYAGLIIAYLVFTMPLSVWLLKGFFDSIPPDMERAARMDGCTRFGAFCRIAVPLATPGMIATVIYTFTIAWNEYMYALAMTSSANMRVLQLGINAFFRQETTDWGGLMAWAFIMSVPIVILFGALQKFFLRALTAGSLKY